MNRIMVKASCLTGGFKFRVFSQEEKLLGEMYVPRSIFKDLEEREYAAHHALESYAVFQRDCCPRNVTVRFAWFSRSGEQPSDKEEAVTLDYEKLMAFVRDSAEPDGPKTWRELSVVPRTALPRMVFCCYERLVECIDNEVVQHKLVRFLRDNFQWPNVDYITFYPGFMPYSFFFRGYCDRKSVICGDMVLHGQENLPKAHYCIHI